jgi:rod shape-determining protein MreD
VIGTRTMYLVYVVSLLIAILLQLVQLPDFLSVARPLWLPLLLSYWALTEPRVSTLFGGFMLGVAADVLFGTVLGQHAVALVLVAYLVQKLRPLFFMFPLWQATLGLIPVWLLYSFVMFWADGSTDHRADPLLRWLPLVSTTLFWPLVYTMLELLMRREEEE